MTDSNLKFKPVAGDKLFYNKWEYCLRASLLEVSCLRANNYDLDVVDEILDTRQRWRATMSKRWMKDIAPPKKVITQQVRDNLHDFAKFMSNVQESHKLVVSMSTLYIYTNSQTLLASVDRLPYLRHKRYRKAVVDRPPNTILFKRANHQYRSYLRGARFDHVEKQRMRNFLNNYPGVRTSPGLAGWLENDKYIRTMEHFFVDYDDPGWALLLSLVRPNIIRKTVQIMAK